MGVTLPYAATTRRSRLLETGGHALCVSLRRDDPGLGPHDCASQPRHALQEALLSLAGDRVSGRERLPVADVHRSLGVDQRTPPAGASTAVSLINAHERGETAICSSAVYTGFLAVLILEQALR